MGRVYNMVRKEKMKKWRCVIASCKNRGTSEQRASERWERRSQPPLGAERRGGGCSERRRRRSHKIPGMASGTGAGDNAQRSEGSEFGREMVW